MARKVETLVTLTDDLDGGKGDRTVSFAVDGVSYEIDLSKRNATAFTKALAPYVDAARKAPRTARSRASGAGQARGRSRSDLADIRAWARANGHSVSERGRIAGDVVQAYNQAH
jgi:hypothetical protein